MIYKRSIEAERNALAHGRFGGSDQIKDGIAWINPMHLTRHTVSITRTGVTDEAMQWLRDHTYVYELADLETIARDTQDLYNQIEAFAGYVWAMFDPAPDRDSWRAARYPQLCSAPRIAQALTQLRESQKNTPEARR